jgi:hypothetical protein
MSGMRKPGGEEAVCFEIRVNIARKGTGAPANVSVTGPSVSALVLRENVDARPLYVGRENGGERSRSGKVWVAGQRQPERYAQKA